MSIIPLHLYPHFKFDPLDALYFPERWNLVILKSQETTNCFSSKLKAWYFRFSPTFLSETIPQLPQFSCKYFFYLRADYNDASSGFGLWAKTLRGQKWHGFSIFLIRCDWHLIKGCVKIKRMEISMAGRTGNLGWQASLQTFRSNTARVSRVGKKYGFFCSLGHRGFLASSSYCR